jgi:hypothetical protein
MRRVLRRNPIAIALRVAVIGVLAGAAVVAPVRMARGNPQTRFAAIPTAVEAAPGTVGTAGVGADAAGPMVPPRAGAPVAAPFPLSHLGLRWQGSDDSAIDARLADAGGRWGPWRRMAHDHDLDDPGVRGVPGDSAGGPVLSTLIRAEGATRVQVRAAGDARHVEILAIDTRFGPRPLVVAAGRPAGAADPPPEEGGEDPDRRGPATETGDTGAAVDPSPAVDQPEVVTRQQWGADESLRKGTPKFAPITKLFVHHTVTAPDGSDPDPAATVRAIYAYHTQGNGWDDIGYNFLVDSTGRIYEGRWARDYGPGEIPTGEAGNGYGVAGAQVSGHNFGSAGVAMIGDFTNIEPSSAAMRSLERMLAWKADRHDIDVQASDPFITSDGTTEVFPNLAGHRDAGKTACPGDRLYPLLPGLRQRVASVVTLANAPTKGYWTATADGRVLPFGAAQSAGSLAGRQLNAPIVGMAPTPSGGGYWLLGADGGVFSFGDARFFGSTGDMKLNQPVVRLEATPTGKGYWLVAADGGMFSFGDAAFFGSTGGMKLNRSVVGMSATPSGRGYWLVAADGGIFAFGDADFRGSTGSLMLNSPIVSMSADRDRGGYWLVARDGGVFAFDVPFFGSIPGLGVSGYAGSVQIRATETARGYYIADTSGGIYTFGDARFHGANANQKPPAGAVDLALVPEDISQKKKTS